MAGHSLCVGYHAMPPFQVVKCLLDNPPSELGLNPDLVCQDHLRSENDVIMSRLRKQAQLGPLHTSILDKYYVF